MTTGMIPFFFFFFFLTTSSKFGWVRTVIFTTKLTAWEIYSVLLVISISCSRGFGSSPASATPLRFFLCLPSLYFFLYFFLSLTSSYPFFSNPFFALLSFFCPLFKKERKQRQKINAKTTIFLLFFCSSCFFPSLPSSLLFVIQKKEGGK